ncbi:MAG: beta-ketoacyl synthase N-terminal-like domain-containing protein, partial [Methylocystis sp.]
MNTIIAITPSYSITPNRSCDPKIAIAACRAGEIGILDLGWRDDDLAITAALEEMRAKAGAVGQWGVRWDALGDESRGLGRLAEILRNPVDIVVLAGVTPQTAAKSRKAAKRLGRRVFLEVCDKDFAIAAQAAGYDGLIVKGHEAGGRVGKSSSFILLQELRGQIKIPYWIQGGSGIGSAAASVLAGASGVVLGEHLWLTEEGPFASPEQKAPWSQLDGSETILVGQDAELTRLSSRHGRGKLRELDLAVAKGDDWRSLLRQLLRDENDPLIPIGQDVAFAAALARRYATTGRIVAAFRDGVEAALSQASIENPLRPESPLAKLHGTRFPIVQGPMTRVSDVAPFAKEVADGGGLPFLALAVMRGPQARELLVKTKELMGQRPWGVGILGFMPLDLRQEQMEAIREVKPPFAIIAGGRPSQAKEMEALNISAYLHVPSPGLLQGFIKEGARKFIFEGSECGGHTGPRTSFILWESAIEILLNTKIDDPESVQILFAGGIHDAVSAAIVSVLAAPLTARGMKVGVLMGTAYLFTSESVRSGAVAQTFQEEAIACRETALLQSGVGVYTRCANTPFCQEFDEARRQLLLQNKSDKDILLALELLNVGRLRIASKGVTRNDDPVTGDDGSRFVTVDAKTQRREGMYMMGEVARLRAAALTISELHAEVSMGAAAMLARSEQPARVVSGSALRESIAVVGMSCLLPGAKDLHSYWRNILSAFDAIREVPEERWRPADFYDPKPAAPDKIYSKWGGFLDDIAFDPTRYGIPPASLRYIEPMQLLALLVASKALEDAGFDRRPFPRERTATIFAVGGMNDLGTVYIFRTLLAHYLPKAEGVSPETRQRILESLHRDALPKWTEDSFPGFLGNVVAGRVANRLDLRGANFTVDAACASSLAALDAGIRQLRDGDADVALVGAVDGTNSAVSFMAFAQTHALSPRGRCRPFDDSADGIALGEGVAAVILKRLSDAERDGDKIYSVIKGVGSSSDGHNRSLTAPHPEGQVLALKRAYADAGVDPASVSLIEAHGTGTALGDKSEIMALNMAFGDASAERQYCAVGSVKSMIGHTKVTAGLAALIKASLALKQRVLPPTIGVEKPNSRVDFSQTPFYINTQPRPWLAGGARRPRRCGVSAFGFGGTNFHTVLEEYQGDFRASDEQDLSPRPAEIFTFGRANGAEIEKAARSLLQSLAQHGLAQSDPLDFAQLAYSAHLDEAKVRPKNGGCVAQLAVVASSVVDLKAKLEFFLRECQGKSSLKAPRGVYYRDQQHRGDTGAVCMLFPGQGSQKINMLRDLVVSRPSSHALFERADALLESALPRPLSRFVYPLPAFTQEEQERQQSELNDTRVAQPALGVADLTAFDIVTEFGLKPNFVAGHSYGECVALCVAGALSRDELIHLSEARGRIAAQASGSQSGTMAAVNADERQVVAAIARLGLAVSVANLNAPDQTIIAGSMAAIDAAVEALTKEQIRVKRLAVTAAFHCEAMAAARDAFAAELAKVGFRRPRIPVFSNTTARPYPEEPREIEALLARHIAEPLRFVEEIERLYEAGARVFIECGPGLVLSGLVDRILGDRPHVTLGVDAPERSGWLQLAQLLAQAFALGLPINLEPWFKPRGLARISLAQALEQARAEAHPGPMTWRVNGGRAAPFNTPPEAPKAAPKVAMTPPKAVTKALTPAAPARAPLGLTVVGEEDAGAPRISSPRAVFVASERSSAVLNYNPPSSASAPPGGPDAHSPERFAQAQNSLSQLLDLQREQQEILRRFLEFQEGWLTGQSQMAAVEPSAMTAPAARSRSFERTEPIAPIAPPIPALPKLVLAPSANGSGANGFGAKAPERAASAVAPAPAALPERTGKT